MEHRTGVSRRVPPVAASLAPPVPNHVPNSPQRGRQAPTGANNSRQHQLREPTAPSRTGRRPLRSARDPQAGPPRKTRPLRHQRRPTPNHRLVLGSSRKRRQALRPTGGNAQGEPPLSAPIRFRDRLAHQHLDKLDADLLWETTVRETPVRLRIIEQPRDQDDQYARGTKHTRY